MMNESGNAMFFVRINGVLPDVSGAAAGEGGGAHTSISVFSGGFHLLVDAGDGVADSVKKGASDLGYKEEPDAILVTHGRREHVSDLASFSGKIFCTSECAGQIAKELPQVDKSRFATVVVPGQPFEAGPFSIVPVAADNAGDSPGFPGSVIYVIRAGDRKVIAGWDFISLQNASADLMWNPDLAVLGTETYNDHPSTGIISVTQAYHLVKTWNAKDCYVLHYSGEKDKEDAKNQWHRGPAGPLSPEELQKTVDSYLRMAGQDNKISIKVARQGMVWRPAAGTTVESAAEDDDSSPVGNKIEIEALEKYVFGIEKMPGNRLMFVLEDSISRQESEFVNPRRKDSDGSSLHADAIKSMMMKGPELDLTISGTTVKTSIIKGKKPLFAGDIRVSERDAKKLSRYIRENF
ncbi:MBL fold metallo-hydrolase [Nitrososphaera viennensis]|mgnify:CR=1 FL=1|uniref:MBL fold metallo-hydrolase n=2 Tax=Nitrososphaera viennensis TaxID=1034015 RepID=A0A977NLI5_9ARCH|nr:MBL fold metallo-hydrolase [Nitrososphaera viennensis]AIC16544.1 putative beta-lactamase domain protein [Nitrososphaera viennensis EN76]UVS68477.1 MBL fold metallo-hydrolase [Nitrososphaera viennensis]